MTGQPTCSVNHAHLTVIFATAGHVPTLLKLAPKFPVLKLIISIDELSPETHKLLTAWGQTLNVQIKDLRESKYTLSTRSTIIAYSNV
jgi:hypothetical protein